jgi:hypothetical protein
MRKAKLFSNKVSTWEMISTNAKPHITDMPFLQPVVSDLDGLIAEAKGLDSDQEVARKQLADITHRRQELERNGETLRARISAYLKGSFGYTSDQLIQFGIKPRPSRKKKVAPPAATTPSTPTHTPTPTPPHNPAQ